MHTPKLALLLALAAGSAHAQPAGSSGPDLRTVAEKTDYKSTARHADVVALCDALAAFSPKATRLALGASVEGRELPLLVIADPPVHSPAECQAAIAKGDRILVFAIGNIHAGEVDGKEALPMLARELLSVPDHPLLKHVIFAMAPIYNADGNERVAKGHRPGQDGPEETGIRENADGLDLNRDFIKLDAPETRGLVHFLNDWDPAMFIDCHITNGSYHRYLITYAGAKVPAGDPQVISFTKATLFPALAKDFASHTKWDTFWYGSFGGEFGGQRDRSIWETFPAQPRYGTNYVGLRNRLSVLVESYTYSPFKDRVAGTLAYVKSALTFMNDHHADVTELLKSADQRTIAAGKLARDEVAVATKATTRPEPYSIKGYVEIEKDGHSTRTNDFKEYPVKLEDDFVPTKSVHRPLAYALPPDTPVPVIQRLMLHGVQMRILTKPFEADVDVATIQKATPASREYQKHVIVSVEVARTPAKRTIPPGSTLITTAQPLGDLAVYMLEPDSEDGLTAWNFFDSYLKLGAEFPVLAVRSPLPE